jgi:hypothetical protein
MTSLAFEVYYSHEGQIPRPPLSADDVTLALQRVPSDLEHRLPPGSSVSIDSATNASIVVKIDSPALANQIKRVVEESMDSFQLYAKFLDASPP